MFRQALHLTVPILLAAVCCAGCGGARRANVEALRAAAEEGNAMAQWMLGGRYQRGEGVPSDMVQAIEWYEKAGNQGLAPAQLQLGFIFDVGAGVPEDQERAVLWVRKAAEQGDAGGQFWLGNKYAEGEGVPRDLVAAYQWFDLAAQDRAAAIEARDKLAEQMTADQIAEAKRRSADFRAILETAAEPNERDGGG